MDYDRIPEGECPVSAPNHMLVKGWSKDGRIAYPAIALPMRWVRCWRCAGTGSVWLSADPEFFNDDEEGSYSDLQEQEGICPQCDGLKTEWQLDREACMTRLSTYKGLIRYDNWLRLTFCGRTRHDYDPRIHESRPGQSRPSLSEDRGGMPQGHRDRLL